MRFEEKIGNWLEQSWKKTYSKKWWINTPHRLFWIVGIPLFVFSIVIIPFIILALTYVDPIQ